MRHAKRGELGGDWGHGPLLGETWLQLERAGQALRGLGGPGKPSGLDSRAEGKPVEAG